MKESRIIDALQSIDSCSTSDESNDCTDTETMSKLITSAPLDTEDCITKVSQQQLWYLSQEERLTVALAGEVVNKVVYEYNRFTWEQKLYDTELYRRSDKRKNCFIKAVVSQGKELYCKIKALVTVKKCNCEIQHHEDCHCLKHNVLMGMPLKVVNNRLFQCDNFRITSGFLLEGLESTHSIIF